MQYNNIINKAYNSSDGCRSKMFFRYIKDRVRSSIEPWELHISLFVDMLKALPILT